MKKFSLVSNESIRRHLANTSPAKITHAFPKGRRFFATNPECKQAFYESSTSLSKRGSGIGFGRRSDFTQTRTVSPGSPSYKAQSEFDKLGQTYSFALGRQHSPQRHYTYHRLKEAVPGPGQYESAKSSLTKISYSQRPRTIDLSRTKLSFLENPGPGQYDSLDLTPTNGKLQLSKYNNSRLSIINKDLRFREKPIETPAANAYNTLDNLNAQSKYTLSQRRGLGTRPFDRERKFTNKYWRYDSNPAPCSYEKPSDFGVYGDSKYYKTLSFKD